MGPTAERRRAAALAGFTGNVDEATSALADAEPSVREAALRSLARLGALDEPRLLSALRDSAAPVRIAALEIAATRDQPAIGFMLDDVDPAVIEQAAWANGERPNELSDDVIDRLVSLCGGHDDPLVRESAVAALGALGVERTQAAVLAATRDKPAVRRRAILALAAFGGPEVDAAWARARTDPDRQVRDAVDELLGPATTA